MSTRQTVRLTAPRRKALEVLRYGHLHGIPVTESNRTGRFIAPDRESLHVYWQIVRWLVGEGYVETERVKWRTVLTLTPVGHELAREVSPQ